MRTYVTGSSGFLGSHLLPKLKGEVITIPHDEIQSTKLEPFDYFYFLSSYGNLHHQQTDDEKIFKANVLDPLSVMYKIKDFKFKSFVYMSSSSVNLRHQIMYSRAKRSAEEVLLAMKEKYDLPICILRPFSVTGKGEQKEHLTPTIFRSCLQGEHMNFVGSPTHDFIDVEDVVNGILNLSKHGARGIFELGTGIKRTNQEILDLVESITHKKANITVIDSMRTYDNDEWVSRNYKARGWGWSPEKSILQSLKEMYESYQ